LLWGPLTQEFDTEAPKKETLSWRSLTPTEEAKDSGFSEVERVVKGWEGGDVSRPRPSCFQGVGVEKIRLAKGEGVNQGTARAGTWGRLREGGVFQKRVPWGEKLSRVAGFWK